MSADQQWPEGMILGSFLRGHRAVTYNGCDWVYLDDGTTADADRPCVKCGISAGGKGRPDACLGWLPGVDFACCGHGVPGQEYVKASGVVYPSVAEWRAAVNEAAL
ncbi:MAG: hypothetical protein JWO98_4903 [Frankiales bacterium]|nr:hypothetical protein [Frankiales bacterium]